LIGAGPRAGDAGGAQALLEIVGNRALAVGAGGVDEAVDAVALPGAPAGVVDLVEGDEIRGIGGLQGGSVYSPAAACRACGRDRP
jgi:hypothetical protein